MSSYEQYGLDAAMTVIQAKIFLPRYLEMSKSKILYFISKKFCYIFIAQIVLCSGRKSLHHVTLLKSEVEV